VKITQENLKSNQFGVMFFKPSSFVYAIPEADKLIIIVNLETNFIFKLPNWFAYIVFKKGLRKHGFKGKVERAKNDIILLSVIKYMGKKWRKKK